MKTEKMIKLSSLIEDFNTGIALEPDNKRLYYMRGKFLLKLRNYSNAIIDFTEAIELDKDYAKAYMGRYRARVFTGDYVGSVGDLFKYYQIKERKKNKEKDKCAKTIKIGDQTWSAENLDVDHYRNGDIIPEVQDPEEWLKLTTGAWCYYDNGSKNGKEYGKLYSWYYYDDSGNEKKHGKLYNWYAVNDPRGLAPNGWHIPTREEFKILLPTVNNDGNSLKAEGEGIGRGIGTNKSGFSALFSGYRHYDGDFDGLGYSNCSWCTSEYDEMTGCYLYLYCYGDLTLIYKGNKNYGLSVRIIKDDELNNE